MAQSYVMNGGEGTYSYSNNSSYQKDAASCVKDAIKEAVIKNLDTEKLLHDSKTLVIADLGCSVGPNTFFTMQSIIEAVESTRLNHKHSKNLEFQVMFNDQIANDFNTLFASLPQSRKYFAAAVPGSFYSRLFPSSSIHVAYTSHSLHWLSKLPETGSPPWNPGKIHHTGASDAVVKVYTDQFEADMEIFFRARAEEVAPGGVVVILMVGVPDRAITPRGCLVFTFIESILMDMVKEGVLEQEKVDSFNIPTLFPCIEDMRKVVEKNGCFEIVNLEIKDIDEKKGDGYVEPEKALLHYRAGLEGAMENHFGNQKRDQIFERAMQQKLKFSHILNSSIVYGATNQIFIVLKRKY